MCYSLQLHHHHLHLWCRMVLLPKILDQCRSITSNRFVLNMVKGHHIQLGCHPPLFRNFKWFNSTAAKTHYPIIQKRLMSRYPRMPLDHQLVVLAFIQLYLLFLDALVVYDQYQILSDLICICTYLLLRCQLSDRYGNLFNKVIMLSILISRMLIYIFLLLNITVIFIVYLAAQTFSVEGFAFALATALRVFTCLTWEK